jgi:hypothetical protein
VSVSWMLVKKFGGRRGWAMLLNKLDCSRNDTRKTKSSASTSRHHFPSHVAITFASSSTYFNKSSTACFCIHITYLVRIPILTYFAHESVHHCSRMPSPSSQNLRRTPHTVEQRLENPTVSYTETHSGVFDDSYMGRWMTGTGCICIRVQTLEWRVHVLAYFKAASRLVCLGDG